MTIATLMLLAAGAPHGDVPFRTDVESALRDARISGQPVWLLGSASW